MWDVTGWALVTWFKLTVLLGVLVGIGWLALGSESGLFWLITVGAILTELHIVRQLGREWGHEARFRWWWAR
jgi:hypothetical protein